MGDAAVGGTAISFGSTGSWIPPSSSAVGDLPVSRKANGKGISLMAR